MKETTSKFNYFKFIKNFIWDLPKKEFWGNEKLIKTYALCLSRANLKPRKEVVGRQTLKLDPGQFITGRFKLAESLDMSPSTAWWCIEKLKEFRILDIKKTNKFSIVTIKDWPIEEIIDSKKTTDEQQKNTDSKGYIGNKQAIAKLSQLLGKNFLIRSGEPYRKTKSGWKQIKHPSAYLKAIEPELKEFEAEAERKAKLGII